MAVDFVPFSKVHETLLSKFGRCSEFHKHATPDLEENPSGVFVFPDAQIIAFFNGITKVYPIPFENLVGCKVEEDTFSEDVQTKSTKRDTPIWGNAIISGLLGGLFYSSKKTTTIETKKISVDLYSIVLRYRLEGDVETVKWCFGQDKHLAYHINDVIHQIIGSKK